MNRLKLQDEDINTAMSLSVGEQINVNHIDCSAGEDRKKRLYLKRVDNGIISYCHHCNEHSFVPSNTGKGKRTKAYAKSSCTNSASKRPFSLPNDIESVPSEWPAKARVWCYQYGITDGELTRHGICYSERLKRVVLPVWANGKLQSFQTRKIFDEDCKPKYLTYGNKDSVFHVKHDDGNKLCIVEDILSSIKAGRYVNTMALGNTTLSDAQMNLIISNSYTEFVVFLDDDNAQVKKAQLVIKNRLEQIGTVTIIHSNGRDPKEYSDEELKLCLS